MKRQNQENDALEQLLREALASDAAPSADFTQRLMEKANRTPQERPKQRPHKKLLAAVAACAVIALAIPLAMSGGFGANSSDAACEVVADMDCNVNSGYEDESDDSAYDTADEERSLATVQESADGSDDSDVPCLTLTGQDAVTAAEVLGSMAVEPVSVVGDTAVYDLTASQAETLAAALADTAETWLAKSDSLSFRLVLITEEGAK